MDQFQPNLQLLKAKIKKPWATAECNKITNMGKIICFYVNTHVLKSEPWLFCDYQPPLVHIGPLSLLLLLKVQQPIYFYSSIFMVQSQYKINCKGERKFLLVQCSLHSLNGQIGSMGIRCFQNLLVQAKEQVYLDGTHLILNSLNTLLRYV